MMDGKAPLKSLGRALANFIFLIVIDIFSINKTSLYSVLKFRISIVQSEVCNSSPSYQFLMYEANC